MISEKQKVVIVSLAVLLVGEFFCGIKHGLDLF